MDRQSSHDRSSIIPFNSNIVSKYPIHDIPDSDLMVGKENMIVAMTIFPPGRSCCAHVVMRNHKDFLEPSLLQWTKSFFAVPFHWLPARFRCFWMLEGLPPSKMMKNFDVLRCNTKFILKTSVTFCEQTEIMMSKYYKPEFNDATYIQPMFQAKNTKNQKPLQT